MHKDYLKAMEMIAEKTKNIMDIVNSNVANTIGDDITFSLQDELEIVLQNLESILEISTTKPTKPNNNTIVKAIKEAHAITDAYLNVKVDDVITIEVLREDLEFANKHLVTALHDAEKLQDYTKNTMVDDVYEFMFNADAHIQRMPASPPDEKAELYLNMLLEELTEYATASGNNVFAKYVMMLADTKRKIMHTLLASTPYGANLEAQADALVDFQYILYNAVIGTGLRGIWNELHDEVHDSNMSKFCKRPDDAVLTRVFYAEHKDANKRVPEVVISQNRHTGLSIVKRPDGKILKCITYREANLKPILTKEIKKYVGPVSE